MAHLTMKQIETLWARKDNIYGNWIGDDILVKGCYLGNLEMDLSNDDIKSETYEDTDYNAYYLIIGVNGCNYVAIHEIGCIEDLADRYYYND